LKNDKPIDILNYIKRLYFVVRKISKITNNQARKQNLNQIFPKLVSELRLGALICALKIGNNDGVGTMIKLDSTNY